MTQRNRKVNKGETEIFLTQRISTGKISGETFGLHSLLNIRNLSVELEHHVSILLASCLISFNIFMTFKDFFKTIFRLIEINLRFLPRRRTNLNKYCTSETLRFHYSSPD